MAGADVRPNGSWQSTEIESCEQMSWKVQSFKCTGISLYAYLMSSLASNVFGQRQCIRCVASSTEENAACVRFRRRLSFTLAPWGLGMTTITCHLPAAFIGMTTRLLVIMLVYLLRRNGPVMYPFLASPGHIDGSPHCAPLWKGSWRGRAGTKEFPAFRCGTPVRCHLGVPLPTLGWDALWGLFPRLPFEGK